MIFYTHLKNKKLENFYVESIPTMIADSLTSTRPIKAKLENYNEINSLFDSISYTKVLK